MAGRPALLQRRVHGQARHHTDPRIAADSGPGRGSLADTFTGTTGQKPTLDGARPKVVAELAGHANPPLHDASISAGLTPPTLSRGRASVSSLAHLQRRRLA